MEAHKKRKTPSARGLMIIFPCICVKCQIIIIFLSMFLVHLIESASQSDRVHCCNMRNIKTKTSVRDQGGGGSGIFSPLFAANG